MDDTILELIKLLKIEKYRIKNREIWTLCMNKEHDDKHIGNFSINLNTGQFYCFACGYHGNIIYLLSDKGTKYTKAIQIWKQLRSIHELYIPALPLDKYVVESYIRHGISEYALERVGDKDLLQEYNVYSDVRGNPAFLTMDNRGKYTSVWVRENGHYFLIDPLTAKRDGVLFGEHIVPTDENVLVEGPFDAIAVRKYSGYRGICGFGTYLSQTQINRLLMVGNLVIMMDGDKAGRLAREKIINQLEHALERTGRHRQSIKIAGGYKDDPDELKTALVNIMSKLKSLPEYKFDSIRKKLGYKIC